MNIALIDFEDSYTLNIADAMRRLGVHLDVISHQDVEDITSYTQKYNGLVLSPGPKSPKDVPIAFDLIRGLEGRMPLLGICLGHQALGVYYGHKIEKSTHPTHGLSVEVLLEHDEIFENIIPPFLAMRYNSLTVIDSSYSDLNIIARDTYGEIMALRHKMYPIVGVQFHPESIGTPQGLRFFANWLKSLASSDFSIYSY